MDTTLVPWSDAARGRAGVALLRRPAGGGAAPLVVVSPGLGGDREAYGGLGTGLAARGYAVLHMEHPGTGRDVLRPLARRGRRDRATERPAALGVLSHAMDALARDPRPIAARPGDVSAALDALAGRGADVTRVGVVGHSLGAHTALALAGLAAALPGWPENGWRDPRVVAAVALSPAGRGRLGLGDEAWEAIRAPVLLLAGTRDGGTAGEPPAWRREPFERLRRTERWFGAVEGDHLVFAWADGDRGPAADAIGATVGAFLDAMLRGDAAARRALREGAVAGLRLEHALPAT